MRDQSRALCGAMSSAQRVTVIAVFQVPSEADDTFVAAWEAGRGPLDTAAGGDAATLYRALRPDVAYRFAALARVADAESGRHVAARSADVGAFGSHAGVYEVAREHGAPDGAQGVLLISPFEVSLDLDERFLAAWDPASRMLAAQPGHQGTRLHRSVDPSAALRFVETTRWSSPLALARAMRRPEIHEAVAAMPFTAHPALYLPIRHR